MRMAWFLRLGQQWQLGLLCFIFQHSPTHPLHHSSHPSPHSLRPQRQPLLELLSQWSIYFSLSLSHIFESALTRTTPSWN